MFLVTTYFTNNTVKRWKKWSCNEWKWRGASLLAFVWLLGSGCYLVQSQSIWPSRTPWRIFSHLQNHRIQRIAIWFARPSGRCLRHWRRTRRIHHIQLGLFCVCPRGWRSQGPFRRAALLTAYLGQHSWCLRVSQVRLVLYREETLLQLWILEACLHFLYLLAIVWILLILWACSSSARWPQTVFPTRIWFWFPQYWYSWSSLG